MRSRVTKIRGNGNFDIIRNSLLKSIELIKSSGSETEIPDGSGSLESDSGVSGIFGSLIENSPDIITRFDRTFRHVFINKAIEKYSAIPAKDWIGKTQEEMGLPQEMIDLWEKNLGLVFSNGDSINFEFTQSGPEGEKYFDVLMVPEYDEKKEINFVLSYVRDVSTLKETENLLKSKNSELDAFIYKASHDLKGPLASIIGIANVAKYEVRDKNALKMFEFISDSTKRLDSLLQNLLQISLISHSELNIEEIDIKKLFREIVLSLKHTSYAKDVDVNIQIDSGHTIKSDKKLLVSVFQNLIENSMKYKSRNDFEKIINITSRQKNGSWTIQIADNGMGISEKFKNRIFEMFFRANAEVSGTGLGLFIVKNSVVKLKGSISFKSKENEGTTFLLKFPIHIK
jgi:PAS domain S-box-containing protein